MYRDENYYSRGPWLGERIGPVKGLGAHIYYGPYFSGPSAESPTREAAGSPLLLDRNPCGPGVGVGLIRARSKGALNRVWAQFFGTTTTTTRGHHIYHFPAHASYSGGPKTGGCRNDFFGLSHVSSKNHPQALFSSQKILQNFSDSPSHRIFRHMHKVLNIDKNKK